jgi:hypothetical protein
MAGNGSRILPSKYTCCLYHVERPRLRQDLPVAFFGLALAPVALLELV